ncbi:rhomboid family intramembrane serine protease [Ligilactobacillus equi]|nr:rhomboid family intramembrane serine protease [Ligilactobacillus sp.]
MRPSKTIWVTQSLIVLNLLVYLAVLIFSNFHLSTLALITAGAKYGPSIYQGQWWRLVTAVFLHGNLEHLLMNMLTLYFMGGYIERFFGHIKMLALYFIGGIAGNIASLSFSPLTVSVGASGAVFALFGAFLMYGQFHRDNGPLWSLTRQFGLLILLNFIFIGANIDWQAHLGGLLAGYLTAYVLSYPDLTSNCPPKNQRILAGLVLIIIYLLLYIKGLNY